MITSWEPLVDALRDEMQEYGGLLSLFDSQQEAILRREPSAVLGLSDAVNTQLKTVQQRRKHRENLVRESAESLGREGRCTLRDLIESFPQKVQSLLYALVDEVNSLLTKTKRRARQNKMLLTRSVEVSQEIVSKLNPGAMVKSYSPTGRVTISVAGSKSRCLEHR